MVKIVDFMLCIFYHSKQMGNKIFLYWAFCVFKYKSYVRQFGVVLKTVDLGPDPDCDVLKLLCLSFIIC